MKTGEEWPVKTGEPFVMCRLPSAIDLLTTGHSPRAHSPLSRASRRRGVTLVEMLVTLAILLLMMTAIVKIFQAATGALNAAQVYQELDNQLRLLDLTIRSDLNGVTCKLTPPNNPKNNPGYLEYGENEFADLQGEDSDDYIRFTAKSPAGRPFTGRMWIRAAAISSNSGATNQLPQPITISSEYAEIIYFLRNGNLYRRVLLVTPERQSTIEPSVNNVNPNLNNAGFFPVALGLNPNNQVSWQAVNDISAHPAPSGLPYQGNSVVLNTLAHLTNRENRFAYQRFANDYWNKGLNVVGPDGLADDLNQDNVPDYYPTLYPGAFAYAPAGVAGQLIYEPNYLNFNRPGMAWMSFPYVFPGAYSRPQLLSSANLVGQAGWIHSPEPEVADKLGNYYEYDVASLSYLQNLNHNPIDVGDNLPLPYPLGQQTWWGFPTWRETLSPSWYDPTWQVNTNLSQPFGLAGQQANVTVGNPLQFLPDMTGNYRNTPQPYNDGLPNNAAPNPVPNGFFPLGSPQYTLWSLGWEDDLIMTGVRSFDIKAYDNALADYADLGYGDDTRIAGQVFIPDPLGNYISPAAVSPSPFLLGNADYLNPKNTTLMYEWPPTAPIKGVPTDYINQTFAHEGRVPPLFLDNRLDPQFPNTTYQVPIGGINGPPGGTTTAQYPLINQNYLSNVGDNSSGVFRLRRVWDSWSTDYSQAPATGVNPNGFPAGPPYSPPIYPSYPPPYPAPLRGIQIQIRVTDPTNQRVKTLTIRQDFTDKL